MFDSKNGYFLICFYSYVVKSCDSTVFEQVKSRPNLSVGQLNQ